jgi:hypothetical protein
MYQRMRPIGSRIVAWHLSEWRKNALRKPSMYRATAAASCSRHIWPRRLPAFMIRMWTTQRARSRRYPSSLPCPGRRLPVHSSYFSALISLTRTSQGSQPQSELQHTCAHTPAAMYQRIRRFGLRLIVRHLAPGAEMHAYTHVPGGAEMIDH